MIRGWSGGGDAGAGVRKLSGSGNLSERVP